MSEQPSVTGGDIPPAIEGTTEPVTGDVVLSPLPIVEPKRSKIVVNSQHPVTGGRESLDSLPPLFEPVCITTADSTVKDTCDYDGQTLTNVFIAKETSIADVVLAGNNVNEGWISNSTILSGATLTGGTLTGYVNNYGMIADVHFRGGQLTGGTLSGVIRVRDNALITNVQLAVGTHIKGGKLGGKIQGSPNGPAILDDVIVLEGTELSDVIMGENVRYESVR